MLNPLKYLAEFPNLVVFLALGAHTYAQKGMGYKQVCNY